MDFVVRNLLVSPRRQKGERRRSSGVLNWDATTKPAIARPEVRMGLVIFIPVFALELSRADLHRLEYILGK